MSNLYLIKDGLEIKRYNVGSQALPSENLVPKMTSFTAPSGRVEQSGQFGTFDGWRIFNKSNSSNNDIWISNTNTGWISYDFGVPTEIKSYSIRSRSGSHMQDPRTWTFEGYSGSQWIVLDTRSNQPQFTDYEIRNFQLTSTVTYSKYRINVTANHGDEISNLSICELEILSEAKSYVPTGWQTVGSYPLSKSLFQTHGMIDTSLITKETLQLLTTDDIELLTFNNDLTSNPKARIVNDYYKWNSVSSTLPTSTQFIEQGMNSLTPLLDRAVQNLNPQEMTLDSTFVGEGKLFRKSIDLNKYFDLRTITTETRNS